MFLFLGALPCTEWLDDTVGRDHNGFILTGAAANMDSLLETDIPGVFAAGDVRSGSTKRCATAVGEGAMAVQPSTPTSPAPPPFKERDERRRLRPSGRDRCPRAAGLGRRLRGLPADGGEWLHLRICLICGHVACCDDSPNRHATAHAHATSHPIIRSLEPGEDWNWCYVDEVAFLVDGSAARPASRRRRSCSSSVPAGSRDLRGGKRRTVALRAWSMLGRRSWFAPQAGLGG